MPMPAGTVTRAPSARTSTCARARTASGVPAPEHPIALGRMPLPAFFRNGADGLSGSVLPGRISGAATDSLEARRTTTTGAPTRTSTEAIIATTRTPRRCESGVRCRPVGWERRRRMSGHERHVVDTGDGRRRGERRAAAGELGEHGALQLRAALRDVEEVAALERQQPHARERAQRRGQALLADERQLADEVPRPEVRGERAAAGRVADELELALEDDEEPSRRAVRARDLLARAVVLARRDAGELVEDRRRDVGQERHRRQRARGPDAHRDLDRRAAAL